MEINTEQFCTDLCDTIAECCADLLCECCCGGGTPVFTVVDANPFLPGEVRAQAISPNVLGDYVEGDPANGYPAYVREDGAYWIFHTGGSKYQIGPAVNVFPAAFLHEDFGTDPRGFYNPHLSYPASGNVIVQDYVPPTPPTPGPGLEGLLTNLNANHADITSWVPSIYYFTDGDVGNNIEDGGDDMYDGGNYLNTNLATEFFYTDAVIETSDSEFGSGSTYFTAKYPGLFVMATDSMSISTFEITGNLGADGSGNADGTSFGTSVGGQSYLIFAKRVYGTSDPSVNHIVIVPGGSGVSHSFLSDTNNDLHTISGLSSNGEIYYLLVARSSGGFLDDSDILNIANEFLSNIPVSPFIPMDTEGVLYVKKKGVIGINQQALLKKIRQKKSL